MTKLSFFWVGIVFHNPFSVYRSSFECPQNTFCVPSKYKNEWNEEKMAPKNPLIFTLYTETLQWTREKLESWAASKVRTLFSLHHLITESFYSFYFIDCKTTVLCSQLKTDLSVCSNGCKVFFSINTGTRERWERSPFFEVIPFKNFGRVQNPVLIPNISLPPVYFNFCKGTLCLLQIRLL